MAFFIRDTGDSNNPIQHSKKIFHDHLKQTSARSMFGKKGSGKPIILDTTLKGEAGDTVTHHFVPHANADPLLGQNVTILGNESKIDEYNLPVLIDEVNFAFRKKGRLSDQRTLLNLRSQMSRQITNHFAQWNDDVCFRTLSGVTWNDISRDWELAANTDDRVAGAHRCWRASGSAGAAAVTAANSDNAALVAAMAATDTMSTRLIDEAVTTLQEIDSADTTNISYRMAPIKMGPEGEEFFLLYLSVRAAMDLRDDPKWQSHAMSLAERGLEGKDDLMARGALGVWNNVIIKQSNRVLRNKTAGSHYLARNLLIGADAMVSAWSKTLDYTEEEVDHGRELSSAGCEIRGDKKVTFKGNDGSTDVDMGVAQLISVG